MVTLASISFNTINRFNKEESKKFDLLFKKPKIDPECRYVPNSEAYCNPTNQEMENYREQLKCFKKNAKNS